MEQISKKRYFRSKTEKVNITIEFFKFELVLVPVFSVNWQFWFFEPNLPKKGSYFQSKTDKKDTTIEFCIFELVFVSKFTLNKKFWIFGPNLPKKDIYGQNRKNEHHHWILHIRISPGTKLQSKLAILIFFGLNLPKKGFSWSKTKKVNITMEFCIFELV